MTPAAETSRKALRRVHWGGVVVLLVLAVIPPACTRTSPIRAEPHAESECRRFFEALDAATEAAGVRDAGAAKVTGAPYLRTDRFLASFVGDAEAPANYAAWLERLRTTDADRRRSEIANLGITRVGQGPPSPFPALSTIETVWECGRRLVEQDLRSVDRKNWLRQHTRVPDAYRTWRRVLGVYPLTRLGLEEGVAALHRNLRAAFATPIDQLPRQGSLLRYAPDAPEPVPVERAAEWLREAHRDPLGIPELEPVHLGRLYDTFAPVWEVDTVRPSDRIGAVRWGTHGRPEVAVESPVVYRFTSYARYHQHILLQLNYLIWFPERTASQAIDLYAGQLDGLIWRVTLSPEGQPLAYDTIHPCGCYYHVFPGIGYRVAQPSDGSEAVLSPYPLPPSKPGQRHLIRVSAGRHFVQGVYTDGAENPDRVYRWREARELSSLPMPDIRRRSLFDQDGLVAGTERLERFLLWPSGINSPGAMRQPGTHAIAMLGRRHFDDARLLEALVHPL